MYTFSNILIIFDQLVRIMRYLIFGGAGFIGINFVKSILKSNRKITVYDKLTKVSNAQEILSMSESNYISFINDDICNTKAVFNSIDKFKPNFVINFAAETHVDNSIETPDKFIKTNILGTYSILESLKKYYYKKRNKNEIFRFLNISTDEVFGSLNKDDKPFVG